METKYKQIDTAKDIDAAEITDKVILDLFGVSGSCDHTLYIAGNEPLPTWFLLVDDTRCTGAMARALVLDMDRRNDVLFIHTKGSEKLIALAAKYSDKKIADYRYICRVEENNCH